MPEPGVDDDDRETDATGPPSGASPSPGALPSAAPAGAPPAPAPPGPSRSGPTPDDDAMARTILAPPPPRAPRPDPLDATGARPSQGPDEPTVELATRVVTVGGGRPDSRTAPPAGLRGLRARAAAVLRRYERVLWWLHTCYALGLGLFVATFAQKGFERARWLAVSLALSWMLVALFFRFFGTGARQDFLTAWPDARRRFFVMTYLMKNLFQGTLFFLLPFYWRAASLDAGTAGPFFLVAACAVISTLDLVVDRFLFRWKVMASGFYAVTLFGCLQVVIPALLVGTRTATTVTVSGALTVAAFLLFHLPLAALRRPLVAGIFAALVGGGALAAHALRSAIPAVPMFVRDGGVGPRLGEGGGLPLDVRAFGVEAFGDVWAVSDVAVVGDGEPLSHRWRHEGRLVAGTSAPALSRPSPGTLRVTSILPRGAVPAAPAGRWSVDTVTEGGQVVGRTTFVVRP